MSRFRVICDIVSAFLCFIVIFLLTIELGFTVSVANRELFSQLHFFLMVYFVFDGVFRVLLQPNFKVSLMTRVFDFVLIFPLFGFYFSGFSLLDSYILIQFLLVLVVLGRWTHVNRLFHLMRFNPAQIFVMGFVMVILVGALLLSLPNAQVGAEPISFVDAIFMATSAICVTGLSTQTVASTFTGFGQGILMVLIQIGGLGIMTFYALISVVMHQKFSQRETTLYQESLMTEGSRETKGIFRSIVFFTLFFEFLGAGLLYLFWGKQFGLSEGIFYSVFHSISAFCNAGFSLFSDSLVGFQDNVGVILSVAVLIFVGGIGFPVIFNLMQYDFRKHGFRMLRLQTKLPIVVSLVLLVIGTLVIFLGEYSHALAGMDFAQKLLMSFFHSVSARTAGFNAMDLGSYGTATLWILMLLMFIGASPGSTGGGIKTTTFGLLMVTFWSTIRGRSRIVIFERTITVQNVFRALGIIMVSLMIVMGFLYGLLLSEVFGFFPLLFEVISAFGTVGFSLGVTGDLTDIGKLLLVALMFLGRIGPLTVAFALARRNESPKYKYPEERMLLG